jgi:hypothetical protein
VRQRLAAVLGPRLVEGAMSDSVVGMAQSAKPPGVPVAALAGAVGAALEALRPVDERLVLRHVPADLPPYRDRRPLVLAAAAVTVLAAAGVYGAMNVDFGAPNSTTRVESAARPRAASLPTDQPTAPARRPDETSARASPLVAATLRVESIGPGRVRVAWDDGADGRALVRRFLGRDGGGPDGPSVELRKIGRAAGSFVDDVPGATGLYAWSLGVGEETRAFVDVRVEIELLGPGDEGGARFALRRPWRDGTATLAVDVAPGGRVGGTDAAVSFDTGLRLDAVRTRVETERAMARVPRFQTDGRVERGADGSAVTGERVVERERRIFEVDAAAPDGSRRTWSRKMTDG